MKTEVERIKDLRDRLDQPWSGEWGKRIDQFAPEYRKLQPADVARLGEDTLWKLWAADWFAKTGTPGLPTPDAKQWEGLRKMTALLADRSKPLGERFCAAHDVCKETFTAEKTQLPVILRALLILEGGVLGTVATKTYTNLLLKWAGKPELTYDDPAAITEALQNVATLIKEWSPKVDAVTVGKRARIAWHLSEIVKAELEEETNPMPEPKEIAIAALKKMVLKVGPDHEFPGDAIWEFADEEVDPAKRPSVFRPLSVEGYIEATGRMTKAVTPDRRSSPATEYRFGRLLKPKSSSGGVSGIVREFHALCDGNLKINPTVLTRLAASMLSKRFLILTGLAGSGKTKLAQAFARWLTPLDSECATIVPVGADWTGNENILGYPDGLQPKNYVARPALDLILHAADHADDPHFLILDEMNMSHVERYFADVLSIIESDEGLELYSGDMTKVETWRQTAAAKPVQPKLKKLPENLFIIGTVNVDETTYMFSPKVLDRANVIEFRMDAGELAGFLGNPAKPDLSKLDGKGASFGKAFVDAAKNPVTVPADVKAAYDAEMLLLFKTLQEHGAEFGYRTAYETARFIHFYKLLGNHADGDTVWFPGAFDCVVFQKLLPKLHGSRAKLGPVLKKLWFLCVNDSAGRGADALKAAEEAARSSDKKAEPSVIVPAGAPYPLSAEKIGRMWRLLIENGFASFAEA